MVIPQTASTRTPYVARPLLLAKELAPRAREVGCCHSGLRRSRNGRCSSQNGNLRCSASAAYTNGDVLDVFLLGFCIVAFSLLALLRKTPSSLGSGSCSNLSGSHNFCLCLRTCAAAQKLHLIGNHVYR